MHLHSHIPLGFRPSDYSCAPVVGDRAVIAHVAMYEQFGSLALHAVRTRGGWRYDFSNTFGWDLRPGRLVSRDTLTLEELIDSLERATVDGGADAWLMEPICGGLGLLPGAVTLTEQREHLRASTQFPVPSSACYPHLRDWYTARHDEWLDHHLIRCLELRHEA
ncbi:MAG: hypothetical protein U0Q55_00095 [Vicinamibacterales bacterium]